MKDKYTPKEILFPKVLEWCNAVRFTKGLAPLDELPKGVQKDGYSCPCGSATGVFVGSWGWAQTKELYGNTATSFPNTDAVAEFVPRFDSGEFPELIAND